MTEYVLSYQPSSEMISRAMVSWVRPQRDRKQKLIRAVLGVVLYLTLVVAIVGLLRYDLVSRQLLLGLAAGLLLTVALWTFYHRINVGKITGFTQDAIVRHGLTEAVLRAEGVALKTQISSSRMDWQCFDEIMPMVGATVLRAGGVVYAVPDAALPAEVTPTHFRADLQNWLEASR